MPRNTSQILLSLALLLFATGAFAQPKRPGASKEIGFLAGSMWYKGDLNPTNMFRSMGLPAYGMYFRQNIDARLSLRAQIMQGSFEVWDADHPDPWQQNRNLNVRNEIHEYSLCAELNFRKHVVGRPKRSMVPFLYAGAAIYNHDPEGYHKEGEREYGWLALQPMGTEGQGSVEGLESYPLFGRFAIPYGLGWKGNLGSGMSFQFEWGSRMIFTDYLDDVSGAYAEISSESPVAILMSNPSPEGPNRPGIGDQRGDAKRRDRYGYFLFSLGFRVSKKATTCWEVL